jgi:hypothetical protein
VVYLVLELIDDPLGLQECDTIHATSAGMLLLSKPNKYWVESSQKRVSPTAWTFRRLHSLVLVSVRGKCGVKSIDNVNL